MLRRWRDDDRGAFAALNADPRVTRYLGGPLAREHSDALAERLAEQFDHGFGFWALELPGHVPFVGFAGLMRPSFSAHFTPCVEVGWRLASEYWGHGYATEAALAALRDGFRRVELPFVVSFTAAGNARSRRVMERLGMHHDATEDFDHPVLPFGDPLRRHVLYRLSRHELARV